MSTTSTTATNTNPVGITGFEFIEFSAPDPDKLHNLFLELGFSRLARHESKAIDYYKQNDIHFLLNREPNSFAQQFTKLHGPCAASTGWRVKNANEAYEAALKRGAEKATGDFTRNGKLVPTIKGVGDSLIYFIDDAKNPDRYQSLGFVPLKNPDLVPSRGFGLIDHLTNNVPQGQLKPLSDFYKNVFGFTEIHYFDIRGKKTGLLSYALRSPCGSFCIPINEGTEAKSQINEYLEEYKGSGIQHIAFLTSDMLKTMDNMAATKIDTLDIDPEYYQEVFQRLPQVTEDRKKLQDYNLLIDGDETGYLIQIFTKNLIGPIFFEFIQRKGHQGFGEGNFGALFRAIERDQERRGVI